MDRPGDENPFAGIPFLGDLAKALSGQGPLSWDAARQFAALTATEGRPEPNVDPAVRYAMGELARVAELQVAAVTGLDANVGGRAPEIVPVTPGRWADRTLEAYRPLFTELATSLGQRPPLTSSTSDGAGAGEPGDDEFAGMAAMLAQFGGLVQPMMLGMAVGSMVGHLARRAFGQYDLPIPRPSSTEILVVPAAIDQFAQEWSLPIDELRLWVIVQEIAGHTTMNAPSIREALTGAVRAHVAGFRPDPSAIFERLGDVEGDDASNPMSALQSAFGDPEVLLGAVTSPEQEALAPRLATLVSVVVGYVDHVVDQVAARVVSNPARFAEAVRRRRIEGSAHDVFVQKLLGLKLDRQAVEQGKAFIAGVVERAGSPGLERLFTSVEALPTPNELVAPGLWLARLDLER